MERVKVKIPIRILKVLALLKRVLLKHNSVGEKSPLNTIDMKLYEELLISAELEHQKAERLYREAKLAMDKRNELLGLIRKPETLLNLLASSRDILLGIYKGRELKLGDWGFDVTISQTKTRDKS